MSWLRFFLIPFAAFCLTAGYCPGQHTSPENRATIANAHAEDSGLLLGLYFPKAASSDNLNRFSINDEDKWVEPEGRYLTFWISRRGDALKIQPIDGLLTPACQRLARGREDPLWRSPVDIV